MTEPAVPDLMSRLAGIEPDSPLALIRDLRPDVIRFTQSSDDAIFRPANDGGLTRLERANAALHIARLLGDDVLAAHYQSTLQASATSPQSDRAKRITTHVERVTMEPGTSKQQHLAELTEAGLSPQAIVALSQVIAYVNYQARVRAGLRALGGRS